MCTSAVKHILSLTEPRDAPGFLKKKRILISSMNDGDIEIARLKVRVHFSKPLGCALPIFESFLVHRISHPESQNLLENIWVILSDINSMSMPILTPH